MNVDTKIIIRKNSTKKNNKLYETCNTRIKSNKQQSMNCVPFPFNTL